MVIARIFNQELRWYLLTYSSKITMFSFYFVKGPAVDATDAPQP
jgi:hypothetical protein